MPWPQKKMGKEKHLLVQSYHSFRKLYEEFLFDKPNACVEWSVIGPYIHIYIFTYWYYYLWKD